MRIPFLSGSRNSEPTPSRAAARTRLSVESLEDRAVPATFYPVTRDDLVAAINASNLTNEADTINLTPSTNYQLNAVDNTTHGANGLPVVTGNLTINGDPNTSGLRATLDGMQSVRILDVAVGGSLTLEDATLSGGVAMAGGAIYNLGEVNVKHTTIQNCQATGTFAIMGTTGTAQGAAIYSRGTLTITGGSQFLNNSAVGATNPYQRSDGGSTGGSGTTGIPTLQGGAAYGGAIYIAGGTASISDTTFSSNSVAGGAGGTWKNRRSGTGGDADGGAIYAAGGTITLRGVTVSNNTARSGLGGAKKGTHGEAGDNGKGGGGGIYIAPSAGVALDLFTVNHTTGNTASTTAPDIYGTYTLI